jgi:hypothetical protein
MIDSESCKVLPSSRIPGKRSDDEQLFQECEGVLNELIRFLLLRATDSKEKFFHRESTFCTRRQFMMRVTSLEKIFQGCASNQKLYTSFVSRYKPH